MFISLLQPMKGAHKKLHLGSLVRINGDCSSILRARGGGGLGWLRYLHPSHLIPHIRYCEVINAPYWAIRAIIMDVCICSNLFEILHTALCL